MRILKHKKKTVHFMKNRIKSKARLFLRFWKFNIKF